MERRLIPLAVFVGTYMTAAIILAAINWNYEFVFYGVILLLEMAGVWYLDRRVRLPTAVLWALAIWGLVHMVGGTMPIPESVTEPGRPLVLYNLRLHPSLPKYDQVVHAYGFFVSTLAAWRALVVGSAGTITARFGPLLAVVLIGVGLGGTNETIEFIATRIMPGTNVGGYENTGWDLVSNFVGCLLAAVVLSVRGESGTRDGNDGVIAVTGPC
jgi:hypothetical protein